MLKQRILTALVLVAVLLPALLYPTPEPLELLALVLLAAAAWEWGRLNGLRQGAALLLVLPCVLLCAASWAVGWAVAAPPWLWALAGGAWVLSGAALLRLGVAGWARVPRALRVAGGVVALWLAWLALAQARQIGVNFLLSILCLVWMADTCAYFAGRALGRRKLAPSISPGKSWEGVWGGVLGVLTLALLWMQADGAWGAQVPSLYSRLAAPSGALLVLGVVFLAAMGVVGDLIESLVKRSAGVKDSSGLLPGHGGVLDRVDALLPTLPLALMLVSFLA